MFVLTYAVIVEPLQPDEVGGVVASLSDFRGCLTAADIPEAAVGAIAGWIAEAKPLDRNIPPPKRRAA